ncbi:MAG: hypothetical protein ACYS26_06610 [Planctomycetota bacterium]|jgi:hypothetical protein
MTLIVTLMRESADLSQVEPVEAPVGPLEETLFALLPAIQNFVDDPAAAAALHPAIDVDAEESPWPLRRNQDFYEPLLRAGIQVALQSQLSELQAAGDFETTPIADGWTYPSIWNPRLDDWDHIDGAAIQMVIGLPLAPNPEGNGVKFLNDPLLPPALRGLASPSLDQLLQLAPKGWRYLFNLHVEETLGEEVRECRYCFQPGALEELEGLVLFFSRTRTRMLGILPASGGLALSETSPLGSLEESATWFVRWAGLPERREELCFVLRYIGDPPVLRATTWLVRQAAPVTAAAAFEPGQPGPVPPEAATVGDLKALATYEWTYASELARRLELTAEPHLAAKRFFLELDRASHPLGLTPEAAEPILRLGEYLANRYRRRALYRHDPEAAADATGDSLPLPQVEAATWAAEGAHSAELLEGLLLEHFSDGDGGVALKEVQEAFERFGGGELTIFGPHGSPNGLNIFCFVELALFLVQSGHRPELWMDLLRAFGAACEIYVRSYHLCGGERSFCAYRVEHNPEGSRAPSEAQRLAVRQAWAGPLPVERYERLLQASLLADLPPIEEPGVRPLDDFGCEPGLELLPIALRIPLRLGAQARRLQRPKE